jgi:hypothetical protein
MKFSWLQKAGELSTNLERILGVLMESEGLRNIHKLRKA